MTWGAENGTGTVDQTQELMGLSEAARALHMSVDQARRLVDEGVLAAIRTPYGRLVKRESVVAEAARRRERQRDA